jgi:succinoglycan biosynthesis transport protein ExoP
MDDDRANLQELLAIARRRIWSIIAPFFVLFPLSVAVILMLPQIYMSTGKILIEDPDIPRELAVSTISSAADKRLQTISQRVMTVDNLAHIIEARNLYPEDRARYSTAESVDRLRGHIVMELITASGSGGGTIAFTVSFQHEDPKVALDVTNDLVALYLRENVRDRQFRAIQTAEFFESETKRLEGVIADLETQLADLRRNHYGSLPEQLEFNQRLISRAEEELRDLDRQAQTLQGQHVYLQTEATKLAGRDGGQQELPEAEKLRTLRLELTSTSSRYGPDHPDVVRLRREVSALKQMAAAPGDRGTLQRQLAQTEAQLAAARERYSDNHPEVVRLSRQADALRASTASAPAAAALPSSASANDPASLQVQQLLQTADLELASVSKQREDIRQRIADYERRIEATPGIQQTYQTLMRQLDAANEQYRNVRNKQTAAQMGELLELERKSERFSLVEPPTEPTAPAKPNRKKLLALAFVVSVGFGFALTAALEMMDSSVRTPRQLVRFAGGPPLAVIPYITTKQEVARRRTMRAALCAGAVLLVAGALAFVHFKVMPLDAALTTMEQLLGAAFAPGDA